MKTITSRNIILRPTMYVAISLLFVALICASAFAGGDGRTSTSSKAVYKGHKNHLALFTGITHHEDNDEFSIGLDYEYRFHKIFGIGGLVEYTGGDCDSWIFGVPVFIHPYKGAQFIVAPGFISEDDETDFLLRLGAGYQVEIGKGWSLTPQYNVDFIEGESELAQVIGVALGFAF